VLVLGLVLCRVVCSWPAVTLYVFINIIYIQDCHTVGVLGLDARYSALFGVVCRFLMAHKNVFNKMKSESGITVDCRTVHSSTVNNCLSLIFWCYLVDPTFFVYNTGI